MKHYGLLGGKLGHSLSPQIHELFFKYTGIEGDYTLLETTQEDLPKRMEELRANSPVYLRVRQLIMERLQQQPPTIEDIAGLLHMTPRSLQRSLQADGWQYRQLLTEVRRDMTRLYLCHTSYSIKEVAYRLGFRELSSFHRFCMRWFGLTPLQLRKAEGKPVARLSDELGLADTVPE